MGTLLKERSGELQNVTDKLQRHIGNICIQHDYRYYRCECLVTSLDLSFIDLAHYKSVQQEKERLKLQEATIKELDKLNENVKEVWTGIGNGRNER